ncbi:MAG: hypothetical protein JXR37_26105 [Kiritimatiellae bacterium]|nr:hypothetical protein [Kiritimatiellia bacterium]
MSNPTNNMTPGNDPAGEQELRRALAGRLVPDVRAPAHVDEAVLGMIDEQARKVRAARRGARVRRWLAVSAAAAAVLLVAIGPPIARHRLRAAHSELVTARQLRVGRAPVDIVDAYRLACRLESRARLPLAYDHNGDGCVDAADVDAIAGRAVSLARTGAVRKDS